MKRVNILSFLCLPLLLLSACKDGLDKDLLVGKWQAVELYEQDEQVEMDLNPVYFEFFENDRYYFQSTLKFSEAGRYYTVGQLLYTTDTTAAEPFEKAVKVTQLSRDSLAFLMNDKGTKKALQLVRMKQ